jgi:hypothetical protein
MKKIYLHIGNGKCGSSALQSYLSKNCNLITRDGKRIAYAALGVDGTIISGSRIKDIQKKSVWQYVSSVNLSNCRDENFSENILKSLNALSQDVIVFSCEGWINELSLAKEFFKEISEQYEVEVVVYVRDPVGWLNSAWWQWGAWADVDFKRWLNHELESVKWIRKIKGWEQSGLAKFVNVRVLSGDVISDFLELLNVQSTASLEKPSVSNKSLPSELLRFFQKRRKLRPTPHDSSIDFSMMRWLDLEGGPDWVIDADTVKYVLSETKDFSLELQEFLSDDQKEIIKNKSEWWDISAFEDKLRNVKKPEFDNLSEEKMSDLLEAAILALEKSDQTTLKNNLK